MSSYYDSINREIAKEYDRIRTENQENHKRMVEKIYSHIPRIQEIDRKLERAGFAMCEQVLDGKLSPNEAIREMKKEVDSLTAEKHALLAENGIPKRAAEPIYSCKKCKDKGYVNGERCACYFEKRYAIMQKMSNICTSTKNTFEQYNLSLYSKEVDPGYGISPYENAKMTLSLAKSFAKGTRTAPDNLLFYGCTGLGKTFTSDCIANAYLQNGKTVFYMSAPRLFTLFEDYKFGRNTTETAKDSIQAVTQTDLFILDDLGTEFHTSYTDSILFDIINTRLTEHKNMIISTNLNPSQIAGIYSDRIASRLMGGFEKVVFFGEDIRIKLA